ncbi:MAG: YhfC family glutamic-type intramembrane protease [Candidatus Wallbacteria bacterium]
MNDKKNMVFVFFSVMLLALASVVSAPAKPISGDINILFTIPAASLLVILIPAIAINASSNSTLNFSMAGWGGLSFALAIFIQQIIISLYVSLRGAGMVFTIADLAVFGLISGCAQEIMKYIFMKFNRSQKIFERENFITMAVSFGTGFTAVEILFLTLKNITGGMALPAGTINMLIPMIERFSAALLHISFSLFLVYGICTGANYIWLTGAAFIHGFVNFMAGMVMKKIITVESLNFELYLLSFAAAVFLCSYLFIFKKIRNL